MPSVFAAARLEEWRRVTAAGADLWVFRTGSADLAEVEPFHLASRGPASTASDRANTMLALIEPEIAGRREFVVLASRGDSGAAALTAEEMVDASCLVAP